MSSLLTWLGTWFLAAAWLLLCGFFLPVDSAGWILAGIGVLLILGAWHRVRWTQVDGWVLLLALPLAIAAMLWPLPYQMGPVLALSGLLVAVGLRRAPWLAPLCIGLGLAGTVWMVQGGAVVAYWWLGSRYHTVPALTPLAYWLGKGLGWQVGSSQGSLFLPNIEGIIQATTTWERLGALPAMLLGAGAVVLLPLVHRRSGHRVWLRTLVASALAASYVVFRYMVLTATVAINNTPMPFWQPLVMAATYLPLSVLLCQALPLHSDLPEPKAPRRDHPFSRYLGLAVAAVLGSISLVALLTCYDPGRLKAGRVLLDEHNSNWEWTTQAMDTEWYGQKSGYNYYSLGQWLRYYYQVDTNFQQRTPDLLNGYDVLVIKTPTAPFAPDEIDAIETWVQAGGGLFLIGDHTNVFGTSSYLNPLARRFGLRFRYDSTYDLATLRATQYERPRLLAHPAVMEMPAFLFATSCTLEAPLLAGNVMVGQALRALPVDYSRRVFFPDKEAEQDYPFGLFLQAASVDHGRGRVVAFTDSTVFSNFTMFLGGKPEFFLGVMNWLNRSERWPWLEDILAALAVLGLAGMLYLAAGLNPWRATIVVAASFLLASAAVPWLGVRFAEASYKLPRPHTEPVTIAFEDEHSRILLPTTPVSGPPEARFQTFYVWTQRLGYVPTLSSSLEEALEQARVLVIIDPLKPFEPAEIGAVERFVSGGGRLLVLAEPHMAGESPHPAAELLAPFRLDLVARRPATGEVHNASGERLGQIRVSGTVNGGETLLVLGGQAPVAAVASYGDGLVAAAAFAQLFSDREMGTTSVVPSSHQRFLYEMEFWLMRGLVTGRFPPLRGPTSGSQ